MGPPGHSTLLIVLRAKARYTGKELDHEPESHKNKSRDFDELNEEKDGENRENPGTGIEQDIGSHYTRDRARSSYTGKRRTCLAENMSH